MPGTSLERQETYPLRKTRNLPPSPHFPLGWETSLWWGTSYLTLLPPPPNTALPPEGSISSADRDTNKTKLPSL